VGSDGGWRRGYTSADRRRGGKRGDERPARVQDLLADFLESAGVGDELARASAVDEWAGAVGPAIAGVTRARSVSGATLVVEVRSSAWLMELNMMKSEILTRLNQGREVPLEKLVFVLSPGS
jgi:predicted nucleic acid-binding Zn ribbon protein